MGPSSIHSRLVVPEGEERRLCHKAPPAGQGERPMFLSGVKLSNQTGGDDTTPPMRLLVVPWGRTETIEGPVVCDAATAQILPGRQKAARADEITLDFDHSSAFGANQGQPRHIAGYGKPEVVPGEGIYLNMTRWTPDGKKFWANYQDLSPAFRQQPGTGRVTFLDSVALTPRGVIEGLSLFSAETETTPITKSTSPPTAPIMDIEKLKAYLTKKGVKFEEGADLETLMSLAAGVMEKEIGGDPAEEKPSEMSAKVAKLEADLARVLAADATRHKASEDAAKAEIVRQASAEGKILPPEDVIKEMSADALRRTAAAAPAGTVRTKPNEGLNPNQKGGAETAVTLSAEEKEVAKHMGISEEEMKKFHAFGDAPVRV
jgi:phage I-like protein